LNGDPLSDHQLDVETDKDKDFSETLAYPVLTAGDAENTFELDVPAGELDLCPIHHHAAWGAVARKLFSAGFTRIWVSASTRTRILGIWVTTADDWGLDFGMMFLRLGGCLHL
jgi:hypothetical protein